MTSPSATIYSAPSTTFTTVTGSRLCWAAIIGGLTAALAFQVLFMLLGAGLGFAIYSPLTDERPILELGAGALLIQGISAVCSLWLGGWVAGRFAPVGTRGSGCLHGLIVWCAATVAGVLFVAGGAGWMMGDMAKLVGGGLSAAAKPAAAATGGLADLAKDAAKQTADTVSSFIEETTGAPNDSSAGAVKARREIGLALGRFVNPLQENSRAQNRTALVQAIAANTDLDQQEAERALDAWTASYDRLKADLKAAKDAAELKAKEAAEKAADALAMFCLGAFAAFVVGAVSASFGGASGARVAVRYVVKGTSATVA